MAMAVDNRQQGPFQSMKYEPHAMGYEGMRYQAPAPPQFTNPWVSGAPANQSHMYATSMPQTDSHRYAPPTPNVSSAYSTAPMATSALASGILPMDPDLFNQSNLQMSQDGMTTSRPYAPPYSSTATSGSYAATSGPYSSAPYGYQTDRRTSHPSVASSMAMDDPSQAQAVPQQSLIDINNRLNTASEAERQSWSDALDASRGMVAMSQSDITPRNIYGGAHQSGRSSTDSYGFPSAHSSHSSISSASTYPSSYYNSSVSEASVGDYSSASEMDIPNPRTLPRPNGLVGGTMPPAPSTMMGQFSSKVSSSSQKKHKCKICDKRFTRPSSLQTHMYSHTGEKPFACDVENCGRHFSVVSNLRRHRKVHKGEGHDHPSPDDDD
ncbi:uncharacterized protein LTR77_003782 [Saxophila tyrrhenica]|uniref:C2H2-type domain-containing protein n=1 Tax=Saxophila tyrrhenica TaxID=1690608 RepID=A0AAV9PFB2_9PEZI|nr:hypothetical protein LTR77_003782 [Saxophila tyrrhenica]